MLAWAGTSGRGGAGCGCTAGRFPFHQCPPPPHLHSLTWKAERTLSAGRSAGSCSGGPAPRWRREGLSAGPGAADSRAWAAHTGPSRTSGGVTVWVARDRAKGSADRRPCRHWTPGAPRGGSASPACAKNRGHKKTPQPSRWGGPRVGPLHLGPAVGSARRWLSTRHRLTTIS